MQHAKFHDSRSRTPWGTKNIQVFFVELTCIASYFEREYVGKKAQTRQVPVDPCYATRLFDLAKALVLTKVD